MFCSRCGKELDENNNCINPECPSNANKNFDTNINVTNDNSNQNFTTNEGSLIPENNTDSNVENANVNNGQAFNEGKQEITQNAEYKSQSNFYNQTNNFDNMNNQGQNNGFNQNASYNQNNGFNPNNGFNQNNSYGQNNNFNNANNGFNQNASYNQNATYGFNTDPNFRDQNGISRQEMFDFIGDKSPEYYLRRWEESQLNPSFIHWNWAAFLFNAFWFFYRKVYSVGAIIFGINIVSMFLLRNLGGLKSLVSIGIMVFSGLLGNQLYIKHCVEKIRSIKLTSPNQDPGFLQQRLRSTGGITWVPVVILIVIYVLLIIIIAVAFAAAFATISPYHYSSYYYW